MRYTLSTHAYRRNCVVHGKRELVAVYAFSIARCRALCSGEMKRHSGGVSMHTFGTFVLCFCHVGMILPGSLVPITGVAASSSTDHVAVSRTAAIARSRYECVRASLSACLYFSSYRLMCALCSFCCAHLFLALLVCADTDKGTHVCV